MTTTKAESISPHAISTPLIASRIALHILIVLNWIYGAAIFGLIVFSFTAESWLMPALKVTGPMMQGMRAVAVLALVCIPLYDVILRRLLDIVESVRAGNPFACKNATRLEVIAWALVGLQVLSLIIGGIAKLVSTANHPFHVDAGFSTSGWLSVLLLFVLARVFAQGARMRDELEGTV